MNSPGKVDPDHRTTGVGVRRLIMRAGETGTPVNPHYEPGT